jgi:NAD(P)-dependent dehydrogenase (short-subunit alcohol dehydrogenase family)
VTVAVITGGASGFGLAMAERCAERKMSVVLLDLDGERAQSEASRLADAHNIEVIGARVDVADAASVEAAAGNVEEKFGHADLVLSNVGVQLFGSIERYTDDEWRWVLDVNVIGSARVARAFLPLLRRSQSGVLAFTTSSSVLDPASRMAAYQSSKFAVWGLAETLHVELADEPVQVAVIFPSGMISRHLETSAAAQPEQVRRDIGTEDDFTAMAASNPGMITALATPEDASRGVLDALLAGERYVITHGDLVGALDGRSEQLRRAALATQADAE